MKINKYLIILIGVVLITGGVVGNILSLDEIDNLNFTENMNPFYSEEDRNIPMRDTNSFDEYKDNYEKISLEELTEEVNDYISYYDTDLEISDIFIFEDSEYYFSIVEEETGRGAMELLVNQYTGNIFPEYGPNMMWNLKYGMHGSGGMMSGRGMMGYNNNDYESFDNNDNEINSKEAYNFGSRYLEKNNIELTLSNESHEFYGYFTYHVEKDAKTVGMLSVNGFTGDVWYHEWHGKLIDIVDSHGDDEH
jgi:hypothetical protein